MKKYQELGLAVGGAMLAVACVSQLAFAGSTNNLLPNADGAYTQWTPNSGTTHYTRVDETNCNGTTDYNRETTVGERDSYAVSMSSIPNGSTINQIDIVPCASRNTTGGGSSQLDVFYRFSGVDSADAGAYALPTGTTPQQLATTTFSGLDLDKGAASTLQLGAVYTSGTKGIRLSRMAAIVTYTSLDSPTSLSTTSTSSAIGLAWSDNSSNEDGFRIERATSEFGTYTQIATSTINATSFEDASVTADTYYCYRVIAFNTGGYSPAYSNTSCNTAYTVVPADPTNLVAVASSTTSAVLTWTDNATNEESYKVERGTDGVNFTEIQSLPRNTIKFTDTGLTSGATYYYQVRAYNPVGYSGYSNIDDVTLP